MFSIIGFGINGITFRNHHKNETNKETGKIIKESEEYLSNKLGRTPTDNEIVEHLNMDISDYNKIISNAYGTSILSFEELIEEANLSEYGLKDRHKIPEHEIESKELYKTLVESVNKLNEKEKLIISLYYKEELKLKDIAQVLEISNSRVSQIHTSALQKLEKSVRNYLYSDN